MGRGQLAVGWWVGGWSWGGGVLQNGLTGGSMALLSITERGRRLGVCSLRRTVNTISAGVLFSPPLPSIPSHKLHPRLPCKFFFFLPSTNWSVLKHDYDIEYITEYKKGLGMRSKVRANVPFLSILLLFIVDLQSMASACCRAVC